MPLSMLQVTTAVRVSLDVAQQPEDANLLPQQCRARLWLLVLQLASFPHWQAVHTVSVARLRAPTGYYDATFDSVTLTNS